MNGTSMKRTASVFTVVAVGISAWAGLAQANGTAPPLSPTQEANVVVEDRIHINETRGANVISTHITIQPGARSPWHYHPGPHFVSVRSGTVRIFETDCSSRTYPAKTGFFDPGPTHRPHVHLLQNPSPSETAEIVITDVRSGDDLRPTVLVDPQPTHDCNF